MVTVLYFLALFGLVVSGFATPVIYDGRAPYNYTGDDLNNSVDPYLSVVKGSTENATYYTTLLGNSLNPTPLWNNYLMPWLPTEQPMTISIDNTSIFVPGGGSPQNGFRRTELIAQKDNNHTALNGMADVGTTVFHVSIRADDMLCLNMSHEYQIVWIEPNDGSHVFEIQLGSPFTIPTGPVPVADAHYLKVRNHALDLLFETPFTSDDWHKLCLTGVEDNSSTPADAAGQGDYHFGVLKLPLADPSEPASEQSNVVYYGIQEGDKEALTYSGVFIESIEGGVSAGWGKTVSPIA
ncbi:hypothetical protein BU15DRAFT_90706 [Melanogaster broomeanus]|nr:hypothetical protein BU15DRAFT_90706 [Melanogaster broomeanus]